MSKVVSAEATMSDEAKSWSRDQWRHAMSRAISSHGGVVFVRESLLRLLQRELNHARKGDRTIERADYVHAVLCSILGDEHLRQEIVTTPQGPDCPVVGDERDEQIKRKR